MTSDRVLLDLLLVRSLGDRAATIFEEGHSVSAMSALLLADVANETAIGLALTHLGGSKAESVRGMLKDLVAKVPALGEHSDAVAALRNARNEVQHRGIVPAASVVEMHLRDMRVFLVAAAKMVFLVDLSDLRTTNLVRQDIIRGALEEALSAIPEGDLDAAIQHAAGAFECYRIAWGKWCRRALGIPPGDEDVQARDISLAAARLAPQWATEPRIADGAWLPLTHATLGLPIPLLARWRVVDRMANGQGDTGDREVSGQELRLLIDRLALAIWSIEGEHPMLFDDPDSPQG